MKEKISIIGYGFVGAALDLGFNKNIEKCLIDPKLDTDISNLKDFNPNFIFICLPTPMKKDGTQDCSIVTETIKELSLEYSSAIVVIKSTVLPDNLEMLSKIHEKIVYNPEFLREKYAEEDFKNTKSLVLGGQIKYSEKVYSLYNSHSVCSLNKEDVFYMDLKSASLIKYSVNSFLAMKVIFFNQLKLMHDSLDCETSWKDFIKTISSDSRIGDSHMNVPGTDGKFGFGGACFPKDISALYGLSKDLEVESSLLREVILANEEIRSSLYDTLDFREKEQNINFKTLPKK